MGEDVYVDLRRSIGLPVYLKCEAFNFAGSIKLKAAAEMIAAAERDGLVSPGSTIVESSSGNMGIALSLLAACKGYRFICVTDSRCTTAARQLMEVLGSEVHVITEPDRETGLLGARLSYIRHLCETNKNYYWTNQYNNVANWQAHYRSTGPAIAKHFPNIDVLFIGSGTTGTLMGCARFFAEWHRPVKIVAVDSVGSVTFGAPASPRMIPGLGTSVRPAIVDESYIDAVVYVPEPDTVMTCHQLARHGFVFGGSTGTVISGARGWLERNHSGEDLTAVAIAPDLGERYLSSLYQQDWLRDMYGDDVIKLLEAAEDIARSTTAEPVCVPPGPMSSGAMSSDRMPSDSTQPESALPVEVGVAGQ